MKGKKSQLGAFVEAKRASYEALKIEYLEQLEAEVKKAGGSENLAAALGMSGPYVRMVKRRGLKTIKDCVELIAQKLYGWKP